MKKMLMRSLLMVLVLSIVLTAFTGFALAASFVVANEASTNIRTSPNTSTKILGTLPKGSAATYLGKLSTDSRGVAWYKVSYGDMTGWVSARYTYLCNTYTSKKSKISYIIATEGSTYLRKSPSKSGKKIDALSKGEYATYLNEYAKDSRGVYWYKVSYGSKTGWVSSRYTSIA